MGALNQSYIMSKIKIILFLLISFTILFSCNKRNVTENNSNKKSSSKDSLWFDIPSIVNTRDTTDIIVYYELEWDNDKLNEQDVYLYYTFNDIDESELKEIIEDQNISKSKDYDIKRHTVTNQDSLIISKKFKNQNTYYFSGILDAFLIKKDNQGEDSLVINRQAYFYQDINVKD